MTIDDHFKRKLEPVMIRLHVNSAVWTQDQMQGLGVILGCLAYEADRTRISLLRVLLRGTKVTTEWTDAMNQAHIEKRGMM